MTRKRKKMPYGLKGCGNTYCSCDGHYGPDPDKSPKKRERRKAKKEIKDEQEKE